MIRGHFWRVSSAVVLVIAGCNPADGSRERHSPDFSQLSPEQRDAQTLGREVFELVDRAVDYRGSHRGRPAISLKQMGVESLTPTTVRRILNVQREPLVTVSFRQASGREIVSCRGDSKILEDASLNGRYTLMCTASSGAQHPMQVVTSGEP
jgi:hypothetical protein